MLMCNMVKEDNKKIIVQKALKNKQISNLFKKYFSNSQLSISVSAGLCFPPVDAAESEAGGV